MADPFHLDPVFLAKQRAAVGLLTDEQLLFDAQRQRQFLAAPKTDLRQQQVTINYLADLRAELTRRGLTQRANLPLVPTPPGMQRNDAGDLVPIPPPPPAPGLRSVSGLLQLSPDTFAQRAAQIERIARAITFASDEVIAGAGPGLERVFGGFSDPVLEAAFQRKLELEREIRALRQALDKRFAALPAIATAAAAAALAKGVSDAGQHPDIPTAPLGTLTVLPTGIGFGPTSLVPLALQPQSQQQQQGSAPNPRAPVRLKPKPPGADATAKPAIPSQSFPDDLFRRNPPDP